MTQTPTDALSVGNLHTAIMEALAEDIQRQRPDAFREEDENGFEGDLVIPTGVTPASAYAVINVSELAEVVLPIVSPTAPVEASGSEREHGPKCWGKTSASDEMAHCYCGSTDLRPQPSGETRERAEKLASALNDLIPAVRAYLMTGDVMSQGIKKNTWEPVLKRAQAALTFDPPTTDATTASALSATIRTSLLGVAPDDQDVTLEDSDWRLILGALEGRK